MTTPTLLDRLRDHINGWVWWHRARLHVVHRDVTVWTDNHLLICRSRRYCATCGRGWQ